MIMRFLISVDVGRGCCRSTSLKCMMLALDSLGLVPAASFYVGEFAEVFLFLPVEFAEVFLFLSVYLLSFFL